MCRCEGVWSGCNIIVLIQADGYFGYDFAVVNFDPENGGLDSLVVGCPLCSRERGRVYVYTHSGNTADPVGVLTHPHPSHTSDCTLLTYPHSSSSH